MSTVADLLEPEVCEHGGRAGFRPDGVPWCPVCRHHQARAARRAASEQRRLDRFAHWTDYGALAANDDIDRD